MINMGVKKKKKKLVKETCLPYYINISLNVKYVFLINNMQYIIVKCSLSKDVSLVSVLQNVII